MLGNLIATLDDPKAVTALLAALDEPTLLTRVAIAAEESGWLPADIVASAVRKFMDTASDDLWTQLIGIMNRAEDPGLTAMRAILERALPQGPRPRKSAMEHSEESLPIAATVCSSLAPRSRPGRSTDAMASRIFSVSTSKG
jgi:hypothetical protein